MSEINDPSQPYLRVLVVDDYLDHAESIARLLRLDGHEVAIACNGQEALQAARTQEPQVVLLGMSMPEVSA
jgi:CheY-like chemotaxis protein